MKKVMFLILSISIFVFCGCQKMYNDIIDDAGKPASIRNITASAGNTQVVLTWNDPTDSGFDHIEISWSPTGGSPVQPVSVTKGVQTQTITGLTNLTLYTFTLKVFDDKSNIVATPTITATPADVAAPANATGINNTPGYTQIVLTWNDPIDSDFANIEITWTPTGGSPAQPVSVAKGIKTLTVTGLTHNTTYSFLLKSVDTLGNKSAGVSVSVTTLTLSSTKDITAFSIKEPVSSVMISGIIVGTNISVSLPEGTTVTSLVATFTTTGSSVKVGSTTQVSGTTSNNFTNAVTYIVTAADSSIKNYTVTVTKKSWGAKTSGLLSSLPWTGIASSADGTKLAAIASTGELYISANSGSSWASRTGLSSHVPRAICSSADGVYLSVAAGWGDMDPDDILFSFDSGSSWAVFPGTPSTEWSSIASSSGGWNVIAAQGTRTDGNGYIYIGEYDGDAWSFSEMSPTNLDWTGVASSYSGAYLVAVAYGGNIYTSTNGGTAWTLRDSVRNWSSVASSSDGSKLIAAVDGGYIYTSTTSGASWTARTGAGSRNWSSVASSSDGSIIVATVSNGYIYSSIDGGANWTEHTSCGSRYWTSVTMSANGSRFAAVADMTQYIYMYE